MISYKYRALTQRAYRQGILADRRHMSGLILDVVVVVIAVLLIIFGIWRGMYKLIFGLVSSLAALVLAVVLASTVTTFVIDKTNVDEMLYEALDETIQQTIPAEVDASNVEITFKEDGTVSIIHNGQDPYESITEYLSNTPLSMVGGVLDSLIMSDTTISVINPTMGQEDAEPVHKTLAGMLSTTAIVYIIMAASFILLWIVMYIVVRLIMALVKRIVRTTYVGHFFDKVLGMVIGLLISMVIIWGTLAVIRLLGTYTWIIPVNEIIEQSTLTKWLYENNFIYNFLVSSTNLQESIAGLLGNLGGETPSVDEESTEGVVSMIARVI